MVLPQPAAATTTASRATTVVVEVRGEVDRAATRRLEQLLCELADTRVPSRSRPSA
jgi:hypothetical protein